MSQHPTVVLEKPSVRRQAEFLTAVRRSRELHGRWVRPPHTAVEYRKFLQRARNASCLAHFVCTRAGDLVGVINISDVVTGNFRSGYLGYYAFVPYAGNGYMRQGLTAVLRLAFRQHGLHRVEANIQPKNVRSIGLVQSLAFRCEGYSARYLKVAGRWCDH